MYTVWLREVKSYYRAKEKFASSLALPIFWFLIFGAGLASSIQFKGLTVSYDVFLVPGIVAMPLLFTSVLAGISLISDKHFGFLKEMLVAPVSRISIVLGKALGVATVATLQAVLILFLSMLLGMKISVSLLLLLPLMLVVSLGFVSLGIALASLLETMEGFQLISTFIVTPMFFLSGAFFPITTLPTWIKVLAFLNPMTYGVETLRYIITNFSTIPFIVSLSFVFAFSTLTTIISSYIFSKRQ